MVNRGTTPTRAKIEVWAGSAALIVCTQPLGLRALVKVDDFNQARTMDGFRPLFSGDQLRGATDVRGCQVESVHGPQSVLLSLCARDLVDLFEIAHPFGIAEESVIEGCFHSSLVKSSFGPDFEIEE